MNAKNLKKQDFEDLLKQSNLMSANSILKTKLYHLKNIEDNFGRLKLEEELDKILIDDIEKIHKLLPKHDKEILKIYMSEYEIKCLVKILKNLKLSRVNEEEIEDVEIWTRRIFKELYGITKAKNLQEFLEFTKKSTFYKLLRENLKNKNIEDVNLFEIEMKLNKKYFEILYKNVDDKNSKELIGTKIDLINIIWIYRMKKYYSMTEKEIENNLINVSYKIIDIKELIKANNYDSISQILKNTKYKKNFTKNEEDFKENIRKYMYKQYKNIFQQAKYNISTVIAYLNLDKIEINNIITIIGGIEYGLDKQKIQERIII